MSRVFLRFATLAVLAYAMAGCGGGGSDTPAVTAPSPVLPAPAVLQGTWVTTLAASGEQVTLTLGATSYQITRGANQAAGMIGVSGDRIDFSNSSACSGTGAYRWTVTGTALAITAVTPDVCPGRSAVLAGFTYAKSG